MTLGLVLTTLFDGDIEQGVLELLVSAYLNCLTLIQLKYQLKEPSVDHNMMTRDRFSKNSFDRERY